jgi:hypothetical protein
MTTETVPMTALVIGDGLSWQRAGLRARRAAG